MIFIVLILLAIPFLTAYFEEASWEENHAIKQLIKEHNQNERKRMKRRWTAHARPGFYI